MPFSKETLEFLFENKMHDSREWFAQHKEPYQKYVIQPLKELVEALSPTLLEIDDRLVTIPRIDKTISRIWRDTRYTKDPSLYRDYMWITFERGDKQEHPGWYFDIGQSGFSYGCGFFMASTGTMDCMRKMVLADSPLYKKAQKAYKSQDVFHMVGDCYKRPRYGDQPKVKQQWLERRGLSFNTDRLKDFDLLFSNNLAEKLCEDFKKTAPIYTFLMAASTENLRLKTEMELAQR